MAKKFAKEVERVIRQKYWYADGDTGGFSISASVVRLAQQLRVTNPNDVMRALEQAFENTEESVVSIDLEGKKVSLIEALSKLQKQYEFKLSVWTVGDSSWQKKKAELTRILKKSRVDFFCDSQDKIAKIQELVEKYNATQVLVVDDKHSNTQKAAGVVRNLGKQALDYHLKLDDPHADQNAFYQWFSSLCQNGQIDSTTLVLMDMDGVLIATNHVLFNGAARNIAALD